MKNKIINLLGLGLISCSILIPSSQPVFASQTNTVTTESSEEEKELSNLRIEAYNTTKGNYESSVSFKVINRATGELVTFSKDGAGEYTVDPNGYYKYLEPNNGFIQITGLNGSYTVEDMGNNVNLYCKSSTNNLSITDKESKSISFEYEQNYGSLSITLLSEDDSAIADAKFVLKNSSGALVYFKQENGVYLYDQSSTSSELSTNTAGKILLDKIPAGTYTIEQTSAPVVYNGELVTKSITIENQKDISTSLVNTKEYGNLVVEVVDLSDNSKSLSGSKFTIKDSKGNNIYFTKNTDGSYSYSRTSADTVITVSNGNLSVSGLPKGSYILTEKTASVGYDLSESKEFDIKKDTTSNIQIKSERAVGSLSITIKDEETGDPIQGFTYQIFLKTDADEEQPICVTKTSTGYEYSIDGESEVITDANGKIYISNIPTGTYYLKQTKASSGYLLDLNNIEQTISSDLETTYETIASKSNSVIVVVDKDGNNIANVEFEILDESGNIIVTDKTNENGKYLISGIPAGKYTLKIKSTPETYANYSDEITFSIDDTGLSDGLGRITLDYNKVTISLGKSDISVILKNKTDNSEITVKTDKDGIATFSKLPYGDYEISLEDESIAFEPISFTIDETSEDISYEIDLINNEISTEKNNEETPVSKKVNNNIIMVIIALIVGAGFGVFAYFSKKNKNNKQNDSDENIQVGYDENGNAIIFEEVEVEMEDSSVLDESETSTENSNDNEENNSSESEETSDDNIEQ